MGSGERHEGDGEMSGCADEQMMRGLLGKRKGGECDENETNKADWGIQTNNS